MPEKPTSEAIAELQKAIEKIQENKNIQDKNRSAQLFADIFVWIFAATISAFIVLGLAWLTKIVFFS